MISCTFGKATRMSQVGSAPTYTCLCTKTVAPNMYRKSRFLGVGQFFPFALDLFAPGQDFLVFGMYFVPVNGVHQQIRVLIFQLFDHSIGGVKQVTDTRSGAAA